jgi:thiol-disulfide isomerase/thioredoxin
VEMPELNKLVEKYKDKKVTFIAVTFEDKGKRNKFLKTKDFNYQISVSDTETIKKFEINSFPTNLIINQQGNLIFKEVGLPKGIFDKLDKVISDNLK